MEPSAAFAAVDDGTPWLMHPCGRRLARSDGPRADPFLRLAQQGCVGASERERLVAKGARKKRVPTVVIAELWRSDQGERLVVFREGGPYLLEDRPRPDVLSRPFLR